MQDQLQPPYLAALPYQVQAEAEKIVQGVQKRVERVRANKSERALQGAAQTLLHDTAWLPASAPEERLEEVKRLRKKWCELLGALRTEAKAQALAAHAVTEERQAAEEAEQAQAWAAHEQAFQQARPPPDLPRPPAIPPISAATSRDLP